VSQLAYSGFFLEESVLRDMGRPVVTLEILKKGRERYNGAVWKAENDE
jgi:hypothetical protein